MKKKQVNWNLITILLALIALVVSIYAIINQGHVDYYKSRIEQLENEKIELKSQLDPDWYRKFNDQKSYFESQISTLAVKLNYANQKIDSALKFPFILKKTNKNQVVLNEQQIRNLNVQLLEGKQNTELLILVEQINKLLERQVSTYQAIEKLNKNYIASQTKTIYEFKTLLDEALSYNLKSRSYYIILTLLGILIITSVVLAKFDLIKRIFKRT